MGEGVGGEEVGEFVVDIRQGQAAAEGEEGGGGEGEEEDEGVGEGSIFGDS